MLGVLKSEPVYETKKRGRGTIRRTKGTQEQMKGAKCHL